jgi:hypothetical protein
MRFKNEIDDKGFPVLLAVAEVDDPVAEPPEVTTSEGVKITEGGGHYEKLSEPSKAMLKRVTEANEPESVQIIPDGNEAKVIVHKDGEPIASLILPTADSDPTLVNELAYSMRAPRTGKPEGVDDREWERRQDAIRDAAREMDFLSEADAREFLAGRAAAPDKVDVSAFLRDVDEQRIDDLVDILDYTLREKVAGMRRSRRWVRLVAPKGWTQRVFAKLGDEDILTVAGRLERRGWSKEDLGSHVIGRVSKEERRDSILSRYNEGGSA